MGNKKTDIKPTPFLHPSQVQIQSFTPEPSTSEPVQWIGECYSQYIVSLCCYFHAFPLLQCGLPTGDSSFGNIHLLQHCPFHQLQGISAPAPWSTSFSCSDLGVPFTSHSFCSLPLSPFSTFCPFLSMFWQRATRLTLHWVHFGAS